MVVENENENEIEAYLSHLSVKGESRTRKAVVLLFGGYLCALKRR